MIHCAGDRRHSVRAHELRQGDREVREGGRSGRQSEATELLQAFVERRNREQEVAEALLIVHAGKVARGATILARGTTRASGDDPPARSIVDATAIAAAQPLRWAAEAVSWLSNPQTPFVGRLR